MLVFCKLICMFDVGYCSVEIDFIEHNLFLTVVFLLSLLFGSAITTDWTIYHKIGWAGLGGIVIPYCVRCHDLNSLLWSLPTYHNLFKGAVSSLLSLLLSTQKGYFNNQNPQPSGTSAGMSTSRQQATGRCR